MHPIKKSNSNQISVVQLPNTGKNEKYDLSFIASRIVAMSVPGFGFQTIYRNDGNVIGKLIKEYFGTNYLVFNLTENKIPSKYIKTFGEKNICSYPFPDHTACTLERLLNMCNCSNDYYMKNDEIKMKSNEEKAVNYIEDLTEKELTKLKLSTMLKKSSMVKKLHIDTDDMIDMAEKEEIEMKNENIEMDSKSVSINSTNSSFNYDTKSPELDYVDNDDSSNEFIASDMENNSDIENYDEKNEIINEGLSDSLSGLNNLSYIGPSLINNSENLSSGLATPAQVAIIGISSSGLCTKNSKLIINSFKNENDEFQKIQKKYAKKNLPLFTIKNDLLLRREESRKYETLFEGFFSSGNVESERKYLVFNKDMMANYTTELSIKSQFLMADENSEKQIFVDSFVIKNFADYYLFTLTVSEQLNNDLKWNVLIYKMKNDNETSHFHKLFNFSIPRDNEIYKNNYGSGIKFNGIKTLSETEILFYLNNHCYRYVLNLNLCYTIMTTFNYYKNTKLNWVLNPLCNCSMNCYYDSTSNSIFSYIPANDESYFIEIDKEVVAQNNKTILTIKDSASSIKLYENAEINGFILVLDENIIY